jgi:hypothetical protein
MELEIKKLKEIALNKLEKPSLYQLNLNEFTRLYNLVFNTKYTIKNFNCGSCLTEALYKIKALKYEEPIIEKVIEEIQPPLENSIETDGKKEKRVNHRKNS